MVSLVNSTIFKIFKNKREFPGSQWLRPHALTAGGLGEIQVQFLVRELRSYKLCRVARKLNKTKKEIIIILI